MKTLYKNIKLNSFPTSIADTKDIFSYIDSNFKKWKTDNNMYKRIGYENLVVKELTEDMKFKEIFTDPDNQHLSQPEIINFCKNHKDELSQKSYTFFLFKSNNEFFVARVGVDDDGSLEVHVRRLERDGVWRAEDRHRVVVPQLETENLGNKTLEDSDTLKCPHCDKKIIINLVK